MRHSSAYCCYMVSKKLLMFGPLPIRIVAGITFIAHGLPKFENIAGTQGFFGSVGLPPELAIPIGFLEEGQSFGSKKKTYKELDLITRLMRLLFNYPFLVEKLAFDFMHWVERRC